jgi:hypothetical protein
MNSKKDCQEAVERVCKEHGLMFTLECLADYALYLSNYKTGVHEGKAYKKLSQDIHSIINNWLGM